MATTYPPLSIGITGGIGSGKSRVGKVLESLGFPVYYADVRAKALMVENQRIINGVKSTFGEEAYFSNGDLNRAYLGQQVFSDPEKLKVLNGIVHPETGKDWIDWVQEKRNRQGHQLTFKEAAILYESGAHLSVDKVWTVYAPKAIRLERSMKRDNAQRQAILSRMDKQMSEIDKLQRADFTIFNDGEHHLLPQIRAGLFVIRSS